MTSTISNNPRDAAKGKRDAARWAVASNTGLLLMKIVIGAVTGSVGVLAEVVNSGADLVGSLIVYLSVRVSDEPPDETHAYGHGKIENLSGIATATLILTGGCYAIVQAVRQLIHPEPLQHLNWALGTMAASALVNFWVSRYLMQRGRDLDSPALLADGHHLKTDVITSLGVVLGLILVRVTGFAQWDSLAALGVALLILYVGFSLARDAVFTLSDRVLPAAEVAILENVLRSNKKVLDFHKLRTRKSGSHRHADVHVQIADTHTFVEAHRLTEDLEDQMREALPNLHPIIHMEPYEDEVEHQRAYHAQEQGRNSPK
jgi:cation diffusion facilitator family transporter